MIIITWDDCSNVLYLPILDVKMRFKVTDVNYTSVLVIVKTMVYAVLQISNRLVRK